MRKFFFLIVSTLVFLFNLQLSLYAFEVTTLSKSEKKKYEHISYIELPHIDWDDEKKSGTIRNSEACLGGVYNQWDNLYVTKNNYQWNAKVRCSVLGGSYQNHLRKTTDRMAKNHCSSKNATALFRGDAKIADQLLSRLSKLTIDALALGTTLNHINISVAYVCDHNKPVKTVSTSNSSSSSYSYSTNNDKPFDNLSDYQLTNSASLRSEIFKVFGDYLRVKSRSDSSLPNCKGAYSTKWNACWGTYEFTGEYKGDRYVGEFKNGDYHGIGTYYSNNKKTHGDSISIQSGELKNGKWNGVSYTKFNSNKFRGDESLRYYEDGATQGVGLYFYGNARGKNSGDIAITTYKNNLMDGLNLNIYSKDHDWDNYIALVEHQNGNQKGNGIEWANGTVNREGYWENWDLKTNKISRFTKNDIKKHIQSALYLTDWVSNTYKNTTPNSILVELEVSFLCKRATTLDGMRWESSSSKFVVYADEAKRRNLTLSQCRAFTGRGDNSNIVASNDNKKDSNGSILAELDDAFLCKRATSLDGMNWESKSTKFSVYVDEAERRNLSLTHCKSLTGRGGDSTTIIASNNSNTDNKPPEFEVMSQVNIVNPEFKISGRLIDDSRVFLTVNGQEIKVDSKGNFTIEGYEADRITLNLVAIDQWKNRSSRKININRIREAPKSVVSFDKLNPSKVKNKSNKNRFALVIGIEKYENISKANYAKRDAQFFIDYAENALGVPSNNVKFFFDDEAKERSKFEIKEWFKKNLRSSSEVYIYFSGHGMAQNNGKELYLLTTDTMIQYIEETALNRNEIFNDIAKYNPKSVTAFLDTCYSGAGRADGEILLAMAKGLVVVDEQQQQLPDNFTLFTAASAKESAWSLPEAKHGTFSYFLMKGMEGDADLNGDNRLTNGELQEYLLDNVSRYAQQQQTPQMIGNSDQVLVKF